MNRYRDRQSQDREYGLLLELIRLMQEQDQHQVHQHTCKNGHSWQHDGTHAGSEQAHICPTCNTGPYWNRT